MIVASSDDAQEDTSQNVSLATGRLDLGEQIVGLRFTNLMLAQGTKIAHAYVQFTGDANGEGDTTSYTIQAEASSSAATFTNADGDLSSRVTGMSVTWEPPAWNNDESGPAQLTVDIGTLLQELVDRPDWNDGSPIVLRFEGSGHRSAESFDGDSRFAAKLIVDLGVSASLPVCASSDAVSDGETHITPASQEVECGRVASTLTGLAGACGYPTPCTCEVVDVKDPSGADRANSFQSSVCFASCDPVVVDAPACDTFDPNEFSECLAMGDSVEACKVHVSATNAEGGVPVCVASGSALAFHAFGERSLCQVAGSADVVVGDRRPKQDPATAGAVEILGGPCPGTSCRVHPYFDLVMNPIEFEVRWASNPVFRDLGAAGRGLETALLDNTGGAAFAPDTILGTGAGRRGSKGLAVDTTNPEPLGFGVAWNDRTCFMQGSLAAGVGDDGVCENDDSIPCAADSPDCDAVGGPCVLPPATDEMLVDLLVDGTLVNQPPRSMAGADQTVECTSSAGASFTLDGRGSSDPDQNLALVSWHAGTRTGPELSRNPVVQQSLGLGDVESYVLRVVDTYAQTDEDTTAAMVVDTTPPEIACNAPAVMRPRAAPISFTATASDVCDPAVAAEVVGYDCFKFTNKGRRVSKLGSCIVSFQGDTVSIRDSGGVDDHIQWFVRAMDDSGNSKLVTCEVLIVR